MRLLLHMEESMDIVSKTDCCKVGASGHVDVRVTRPRMDYERLIGLVAT